jgi:hypothetical protein
MALQPKKEFKKAGDCFKSRLKRQIHLTDSHFF